MIVEFMLIKEEENEERSVKICYGTYPYVFPGSYKRYPDQVEELLRNGYRIVQTSFLRNVNNKKEESVYGTRSINRESSSET